jgi:malonyl-CoA/methylmalonyl-CoA synthetase
MTSSLHNAAGMSGLFGLICSRMANIEKPFIIASDGRTITYGDVVELTGQLAGTLVSLGVAKGDRVAVQTEKSAEALLLYLACLRAGAVYLPINSTYTDAEVGYFLGDAEPALFVCDPARFESLSDVATASGVRQMETLAADGSGSLVERMQSHSAAFQDVRVSGDELAAILYTSGTTGRSKGAMLTHDNLSSNAATLADVWGFSPEDVLLHALPIFHTHGLFVATNTALLSGCTMLFESRFDAARVIALLPQVTCLMGVPTFYSRLLLQPDLTPEVAKGVRLFVSGSAPLSAETHREFKMRTGHAILERYGMTETGMNTSNPLDGDRRAGTVGLPLPGVSLRIAHPETGAVLPQGEIGVIEVRGPNVFRGYWRNPEKTAEEFRPDGFFITGDLGSIDEDGYVTISGRSKDLIISGGFNVYPAEIEAVLDSLAGVAESAVIGVPHPDLGECVTAVVTQRPGASLDPERLRDELAAVLARYKVPRKIIVVEELPRNAMGKVQKNVLRTTYAEFHGPQAVAPTVESGG